MSDEGNFEVGDIVEYILFESRRVNLKFGVVLDTAGQTDVYVWWPRVGLKRHHSGWLQKCR